LQPSLAYGTPSLAANANEGNNSCATVVQVLQDLFYVLLHVFILLVIALLVRRPREDDRTRKYGRLSLSTDGAKNAPWTILGNFIKDLILSLKLKPLIKYCELRDGCEFGIVHTQKSI